MAEGYIQNFGVGVTEGEATLNTDYISSGYCRWRKVGKTVFVVADITLSSAYSSLSVPLITDLPSGVQVNGKNPFTFFYGNDGTASRIQINGNRLLYQYGKSFTAQSYTAYFIYECTTY